MKRTELLFAVALAVAGLALAGSTPVLGQGTGSGSQAQPKLPDEEAKLAEKIQAAPDAAGKLTAAADLIKKHPKTAIRGQVVREIANGIQQTQDPTQKLALTQQFQATFNDPAEDEVVGPLVVDAYADANQIDQAFAKGSEFLSRNPESIRILVELLSIGTEQAKKQNAKYVDQSIRYANQAITLTEADKKPASFDHAEWQQFKIVTLPSIYQSLGLLYMVKGANAEAKASYMKASQIASSDPFNFVMIAALLNEEYQAAAKAYQSMPSGAGKDEQLKKVQALLDTVIDAYAHAIALSEGNASLAQVRQQYLQDLEMYYKYRHNGSTAGMQQLIDKYKVAPKP